MGIEPKFNSYLASKLLSTFLSIFIFLSVRENYIFYPTLTKMLKILRFLSLWKSSVS